MSRLIVALLAVAVAALCAWHFGLQTVVWWLVLAALAVWLADRATAK